MIAFDRGKLKRSGDVELPVGDWFRWGMANPASVAIAFGVLARVVQFLWNRPFWMDEGSLVGCIDEVGRKGLFGPMGSTQLAPPGFLAVEWAAVTLLGHGRMAYRVVPLLAGIASLFLMRDVARRSLDHRHAWMAVALFAAMDDLIYFSSEVKQYSTDVMIGLAIVSASLRYDQGPASPGRLAMLAVGGAVATWFSHPAIFVLASAGLFGLIRSAERRSMRHGISWCVAGLAWLSSFAAVHAVAMTQLDHRRDMWAFWDFAFPTWPVRSAWDAAWPLRRLLFLFASPLNFDMPLGPRWSTVIPAGMAVTGAIRILRRDRALFALLAGPGSFALAASYARLYPFHGRLLLFWMPSVLLFVMGGIEQLHERLAPSRLGRAVYLILLGIVVAFPSLVATYHLGDARDRMELNPYGDRRPARLNPYDFPF